MGAFIARRGLMAVLVLLGVVALVFVITRTFADPARLMLPIDAKEEDYRQLRANLHLDEPIPQQFGRFLLGVASGDLGSSYWQRMPVVELVAQRLPATLLLALTSIAISALVAIPLGVIAAARPGSWIDRFVVSGSLVGVSVAEFWLGLLLIVFVAAGLGILPTSGYGTPAHIILPAITLAARPIGRITQIVRSSMLDELARPHVTVARAKGLAEMQVFYGHALKNAGIPIITLGGLEAAELLAGYTIVVETVFAWPGIGQLGVGAIAQHDLPLIQAVVLFGASVVVLTNLLVDIAYAYLDPRLRHAS
ncbi:MAG TPA: ABC transporter permease [Chloroflexota bacterium]|nr:ABC transporter permease [Chloroflexota bacterium]